MTDRNIIVHVHIFKNAGSSFDGALLTNFNGDFVDHREDHLVRNNKNFLKKYLKENDKVKAFSSHSIYHKAEDFDDVKLHFIYFLRHPIERMKSVYSFEKKQPAEDSSGAEMAKKLDFKEYVAWRMNDDVPATIRNLQTIFLASDGPHHRYIEKKFALALENLNSSPLIGVVDRYDESMVVFEEYLKQFFPKIDLSYIRRNVTDNDVTSSLEDKVKAILQQLDEPLRELVRQKNEFDLELYDEANILLNEKIVEIDNFDKKLKNFNERCKAKQLRLLMDQKKYQEVVELSEELLQQKLKSIHIYLLYAEALQKLKLYDEAIAVYENIILKYPKNAWAYFYQAEAHLAAGYTKEAQRLFDLSVEQFKDKKELISYFSKKMGIKDEI